MVSLPAVILVPAQCYQGTRKYSLPGTTTSHLLRYTRIRWPVAPVAKIKSQAPHKPLNAKRYGRVSSRYNLFQLLPLAICLFSLSSLKVQSCLVPSLHKKASDLHVPLHLHPTLGIASRSQLEASSLPLPTFSVAPPTISEFLSRLRPNLSRSFSLRCGCN